MNDYLAAQAVARPIVTRILYRWPNEVDDVLQDAAVRAIIHQDQFRGECKFETWYTSIAIRTALMRLRSYRQVQWCELTDVYESDRSSPLDEAVRSEQSARLHAAARTLPRALRLEFPRYLAGDECGEDNNRKGRRFRLRKRLREALAGMVMVLFSCVLVHAGPLPDSPRPKVIDKQFLAVYGALAVTKAIDMRSTIDALNRGHRETNPIFGGPHPTVARMALTDLGYFAGEVALGYGLKRYGQHHKWARLFWLIEPSFQSADHIRWARVNGGR